MSEKSLLRPELSGLLPYNAGLTVADVAARPGVTRVAKLGSNENLHGLPTPVHEAMAEALLSSHLYPDPAGRDLGAELASYLGCNGDQIVFGDGSEDLLNVLARAVLQPGDDIVTLYPSFPLHEDYAVMMGANVVRIGLKGDEIDVDALIEATRKPVRLVLFANPMNPAGLWLKPDEMARVLDAQHPETVLCIDEAYVEYAAHADFQSALDLLAAHDKPLLILRTFSKAWGLAGIRIGFGVTNRPELKRGLDLVRTPFNVNHIAQVAALAALANTDQMEVAAAATVAERARMADGLTELGLRFLPSAGNFLFVDMGRSSGPIAELLLNQGVIVKPWKQPGYENFMRISVGLAEDTDQLLVALKSVLKELA